MTDTSVNNGGGTQLDPEPKGTNTESSSPLQWFREGIAGVISVVILIIAAIMMYSTYNYAKNMPVDMDETIIAARKEAYDRQKDIMLYALALLGTVTGYYLGRVPAELHAQQAQKSANNAQAQLQETQTKLTDTAGSAAAAATQVTVVQNEKNVAESKLNRATEALEIVNDAISNTLAEPSEVRKTLGGSAEEAGPSDVADLRRAQQEVEMTLREIRGRKK